MFVFDFCLFACFGLLLVIALKRFAYFIYFYWFWVPTVCFGICGFSGFDLWVVNALFNLGCTFVDTLMKVNSMTS